MESITQYSVFMANKPGVLAQICRALAKDKINIIAMSMMDTAENGVLRLTVDRPEQARLVLRKLNVPTTETEVLAVPLPNRPGAVAEICDRLSRHHVHVSYMYATTGSARSKATVVLKVNDTKKAAKVLAGSRQSAGRDMKIKLRRPAAVRRR
jgi:hypothetical protein